MASVGKIRVQKSTQLKKPVSVTTPIFSRKKEDVNTCSETGFKLGSGFNGCDGGIPAVLEAINTYTSLDSLKSEISKLKEEKSMIEADLKKLNADYAHLQTIIDLCDKLLYKYKFSIPAIENLYETAKKYGEPLEAIKAIEKYGDLKNLENEIERLSTKKAELESRIRGLEQHIKELRGLINELQRSITKTLKPLAEETRNSIESIKTGFEEAIKAISTKYKEHLNMYEEYSKKFGELKAEAAKLEEDLKLARIVNAIIRYPAEAKDLPIDYDILMLNAIIQHCTIKNINPKVKAGELLAEKYYGIYPSTEVELLDLLKWANRGLTSAPKHEV